MKRQNIPGLAVAVIRHGQVLVSKGFGLANVELDVPVNSETIFQSGSVGKQFTAVLTMLLVEDGKIRLDESVRHFFPEAPETWTNITVRHLLTHTSGLPNYEDPSFDLQRNYSEDDLVHRAEGLRLDFAPGDRWNYSNTGYMLLGVLIHRVTGQFYWEVMKERIFTPVGMKTARVISEADIVFHRAAGYVLRGGDLRNQDWVSPSMNTTADGCLYFSLNDLVAWDQTWRSGALLRPDTWKLVREPVRLNSGKPYPYGFGINLFDEDGQRVERHSGGWQGFTAFRAYYLGDDFSVLVLANLAQARTNTIGERIASLLKTSRESAVSPAIKEDPSVTTLLKRLLKEAQEGKLSKNELLYVGGNFFPETANRLASRLSGLGIPQKLTLTESFELGDDEIYRYEVFFGNKVLIARIGVAPHGKVSLLSVNE
jgi:CubicO group peptidase (beta-lactamase class C family)